jgi:hypothetical protein
MRADFTNSTQPGDTAQTGKHHVTPDRTKGKVRKGDVGFKDLDSDNVAVERTLDADEAADERLRQAEIRGDVIEISDDEDDDVMLTPQHGHPGRPPQQVRGSEGPALPKGAESNHRKGKGKRKRERPARLSADKAAKAAAEVARRAPRDGDGSPFFLCDGDIVDAFLDEIDAKAGRPNADFLRDRLREKSKLTDPLPGDAALDPSPRARG